MKGNGVALEGRLLKRHALRYTPAGTPVIDLVIGHSSIQVEAGMERKTQFEIDAVAVGDIAVTLSTVPLDGILQLNGFLAQDRIGKRKIVLHVTEITGAA